MGLVCGLTFPRQLGLVPSYLLWGFIVFRDEHHQAVDPLRLRVPSALAVGECLDIGRPLIGIALSVRQVG